MKKNRYSMIVIAVILAIVATALFLVADVTALFVTAYIFALLGIAGLLVNGLLMQKDAKSYPWAAALPQAAAAYLLTEVIVSVIAVTLEQTGVFTLPLVWLLLIHIVVLAFFAIRIVMLSAGKREITRVEDNVMERTAQWKTLVSDVEALAAISPGVRPVLDAVKYSDPVTSHKIAKHDEKIRDGVGALKQAVDAGDAAKVGELCVTLQRQIEDRNSRAKLLKS